MSKLVMPNSGHWSFTVKDDKAQMWAVLFHGQNCQTGALSKNSMRIVCFGSVSIFPVRDEMQMAVNSLLLVGLCDLKAAYGKLKTRLSKTGLFELQKKQAPPVYPRCRRLVTSATGAISQNILEIIRKRAISLRGWLRPVKFQGSRAGEDIANLISELNRFGQPDIIIVGRGKVSLADFWAFIKGVVAKAIYASRIPVIYVVGHQTEFTLADFVADKRAPTPTPSAAAEIVARSRVEMECYGDRLIIRLDQN